MKLFDAATPFFKGNTHMHTTRSDGRLAPEAACALYAEMGYDFVVVTDHRRVGPTTRCGDMLVMSGAEYDYDFGDQVLHMIAVLPDAGMDGADWPRTDHRALAEMIRAHGGATILAHPAWSMNTTDFMLTLGDVCAAEIYNSVSGMPWNAPRAESGAALDLLANAGRPLPFVAADDSHWYNGEHCRAFTMVQARERTPEAIIEALRAGRFYASQGPRFLDVEILDDRMIVATSPAVSMTFISNVIYVEGRSRAGQGLTREEYRFQRDRGERWVRCEVTDDQGRKAWLSPIDLTALC